MSVNITAEHIRKAEALVAKARANGGLAPVDLDRFYEDQAKAVSDPWAHDCPQVPLGILHMSLGCAPAELGVEEDAYRLAHDARYGSELARRYNDESERIVGKRLLGEGLSDDTLRWPATKALHDIFEARNEWFGQSYWLSQSASADELVALLDRVEARLADLRGFMLPPNWDAEKARLTEAGVPVPRYRGQRGPVTFAMSIYGVESLIFSWVADLLK